MRNLIFGVLLLSVSNTFSQKIVYEAKLDKNKPVVKYDYFPIKNKLVINEAFAAYSTYAIFNNSYEIDVNGKSEKIIDNSNFINLQFSPKNDVIGTIYQESALGKVTNIIFSNKNKYQVLDKKFISHYLFDHFFNDRYKIVLRDQSDNLIDINIEKKDLFLHRFDYINQTKNSIKIQKPNIERLKSEEMMKIKQIAFRPYFDFNNKLEIITKAVFKSNQKSILYRTIYDIDGNITSDTEYQINLKKGFFTYFDTYSTDINSKNAPAPPDRRITATQDLDVNEFYIDPVNEDVFVYGVAKNEKKDPIGFYVNRFSKDGKLIWENFYDVDDVKGFNKSKLFWQAQSIYLYEYMNENTFVISLSGESGGMTDIYNHFFVISKDSGDLVKKASMGSDMKSRKGTFTYGGKYSVFEIEKLDKYKYCSRKTILAIALNEKVKKHINSIVTNQDVFFDSIITAEGIWLVESDNETYFKVTLFNE